MRAATTAIAWLAGLAILAAVSGYFVVLPQLGTPGPARDFAGMTGDPARGQYLIAAAGCVACHTDFKNKGAYLAGGPPLKTPFGTFYAPNITSHKESGIGGWTLTQFARAMVSGVSPDGRHYFPAFPYTSYTGMTARDIADLKSYLDTVKPASAPSRAHEVAWPYSDRSLIGGWKMLYFTDAPFEPVSGRSEQWSRGSYLVNVLGHCGECHTQRDYFGGATGRPHDGNSRGPDGARVPKLRSIQSKDGTKWSKDDLSASLQLGMTPTGDFLGDKMAAVVEHSTSKLTDADLAAMVEYLSSL